jgi:ribonucleoside-diphosphate reductase alpha chain
MECVENDLDWHLLSPDECPGLTEAYGDAYKDLHQHFVAQGKTRETLKARDIWSKIIVSQIETGMPYILFGDSVNKKNNQANLGTIKNSNLCVAPETMILTSKGYYPIKDLEDSDIEIWNGQEFTKTKVTKTGVNQELLKVKLSNGSEIECTPYHKFYIVTGKRPCSHPMLRKIEAKDLTKNMRIIKSDFPVIKNGSDDFPFPYEHGLFSTDGTLENKMSTVFQCNYKALNGECYCGFHIKMYKKEDITNPTIFCKALVGKGNPRITLYGEKKKLVKYLSARLEVLPENNMKTLVVRLPMELKPKFEVPLNCNIDIKLRWLEGLSDGDGCVCKSAGTTAIQISSIHKEFLEKVKYLLQTLGCDPKILIMHKEAERLLPNQKGQNVLYECQTCYRLLLTSWDVAKLYELGFRPKRLEITGEYPRKNTKHWTMVEDIIKTNRVSDTYCFKEEKRGMGIFNGVLTGQCAEVLLHSSKDEIAVCNIATMSLPKFVETNIETGEKFFNHAKLGTVVEVAVANLNKVIDVNFYPVPETAKSNGLHRAIIVGNQGLQNCFFELNLPFESKEAKELNSKIYETIQYYSLKKSNELAKIHGAYSSFEGSPASKGEFQHNMWGVDNKDLTYDWDSLKENVMEFGLRNSMLTASPPTASTSQILGNYESFEPITNNFFTRNTLSGDFPIVNKYLVNDLISLGIWDTKMKDQIIHAQGSIQSIPGIPDNLKKLYKTVWEIPQRALIDMSRDRGIFTDHTQSLNLYVTAPSIAKISSMLFHCWKSGLKTGVYYTRTKSIAQPMQFTVAKENIQEVKKITEKDTADLYCSIDNKEACESCSG